MKLPWWLRRSWQQAQRTVHEAEMSVAAYRFLAAIDAEEKCLAQLADGVPAAPDNRPGTNLAAHDTCELIYGMPTDDHDTERGNH